MDLLLLTLLSIFNSLISYQNQEQDVVRHPKGHIVGPKNKGGRRVEQKLRRIEASFPRSGCIAIDGWMVG